MSFLNDIFDPVGHFFEDAGHTVVNGLATLGQGIYDGGRQAVNFARPIIGGLAPAAGTALGGFVGGPLGAAIGNGLGSVVGNAINGGDNGGLPQQLATAAGSAYLGNRYGSSNNYGRAPAPQPRMNNQMNNQMYGRQMTGRGMMPARNLQRYPQNNRGYAHGGYAHGGHHMGSTIGGAFSYLMPNSLKGIKIGAIGPEGGHHFGQKFGHEILNRLPSGNMHSYHDKLQTGLSHLLQSKLPAMYQPAGLALSTGVRGLGNHLLESSGYGNKTLQDIFSGLPEYMGNKGREAGGFLASYARPYLNRDIRTKTLGDVPGLLGGYLGSLLEDRMFGKPAHHHGHHGESEAVGELFPEHFAHGGYAEGGHSLADLAHLLETAEAMGHHGVH